MPLLDRSARVIHDTWIRLDEAAPPPESTAAIILPLGRLLAEPAWRRHAGPIGVDLPAGGDLAQVEPLLDVLSLIVVPFPGFRDGRGFTIARTLRERHGFDGDIRASGPVLPDQFVALLRVGISTVELPDAADPAPWAEALRLNSTALPFLRRGPVPFEVEPRADGALSGRREPAHL